MWDWAKFFNFLAGSGQVASSKNEVSYQSWSISENGNPIVFLGDSRITVFSNRPNRWKFCIASLGASYEEPYFSDEYSTTEIAKTEAIRKFYGQKPLNSPLPPMRIIRNQEGFFGFIQHCNWLLDEFEGIANSPQIHNLSVLRRPEKMLESSFNRLLEYRQEIENGDYSAEGLDDSHLKVVDEMIPNIENLIEKIHYKIQERINDRKETNYRPK